MPRYNVQNPETKQWRAYSSIVDDYVTDWMDLEEYEKWRQKEYGKDCGSVYEANQMEYKRAEENVIFYHTDWNEKLTCSMQEFLSKVIMLEKEYGYSISHEDGQGAFQIEKYDNYYANWLARASNETDETD